MRLPAVIILMKTGDVEHVPATLNNGWGDSILRPRFGNHKRSELRVRVEIVVADAALLFRSAPHTLQNPEQLAVSSCSTCPLTIA